MDKQKMLEDIDVMFRRKSAATVAYQEYSQSVTAAKLDLEEWKAELAQRYPEQWAKLTTDKSRDIWARNTGGSMAFDKVNSALANELQAQHDLDLVNIEIERLRLLVKVNCEWQGES